MNLFLIGSLWNVFTNTTIQSNITQFNGSSFGSLMGFGMFSSTNSTYYVIDYSANKVYILNEDWSFVTYKTFPYPAYMITVGNSLYMTGNSIIWKLDKDLNSLMQYEATGSLGYTGPPYYRNIFYNSTNCWLYVAPYYLNVIQVFDLALTYNHNISILTYSPLSITGYNNQIYVGTTNAMILVIQNEIIMKQFNGCGASSDALTYILFDDYGYMATSCAHPARTLYLIFANGTLTDKTITAPIITNDYGPFYFGFDSKSRFMHISVYQIIIYN